MRTDDMDHIVSRLLNIGSGDSFRSRGMRVEDGEQVEAALTLAERVQEHVVVGDRLLDQLDEEKHFGRVHHGMDALLSIVQMPAGVPVATFAIGEAGAANAAADEAIPAPVGKLFSLTTSARR